MSREERGIDIDAALGQSTNQGRRRGDGKLTLSGVLAVVISTCALVLILVHHFGEG